MKYNFDEIIDRKGTNALNTDGFRDYIFNAPDTMTFPYADDEFIRMWVADMEFATPDVIIDAMRDRLDKKIFGYTMIFGDDYYETFLNWTKKWYDWSFEKEHLLTSSGIIPALYSLVDYICKPDEKVLIVTPSYAFFKHAADYNGRQLVTSDLINEGGHYKMNFIDLEEKAKDPKTVLCIYCNPHNPTGRVWTQEEQVKFGEICERNDLWVISDEIHCDLLRTGTVHTPLSKLFPKNDKIITCMAPSKTFNLAGMMMSNIIIPNDDLRAIWNEREFFSKNPLSIVASQAAYEKGADWLIELKKYLDENFRYTKEFLDTYLPESNFKISEATYLAWVDVSAYLNVEENLSLFFANNAGVLLEGGNMFVDNSDGYIRLNLSCPKSVLVDGLNRIRDAILNQK